MPFGQVEVFRYVTVNPMSGRIYRYVTLDVFALRNRYSGISRHRIIEIMAECRPELREFPDVTHHESLLIMRSLESLLRVVERNHKASSNDRNDE